MTIKSPLRYPGGKTNLVKELVPRILSKAHPSKNICSPFAGGCSVELALAEQGREVFAFDAFRPLYEFWHCLKKNRDGLIEMVTQLRREKSPHLDKKTFLSLQKELKEWLAGYEKNSKTPRKAWEQYWLGKLNPRTAAIYFVLNRSSYNGGVLSSGYSPGAPRFTADSIDKLAKCKLPKNLYLGHCEAGSSIYAHTDSFLFLDPPYLLEGKNNLYGVHGDLHKGFYHEALALKLDNRQHWLLCYQDCEWVRERYKDCWIEKLGANEVTITPPARGEGY